MNDWQPESVRGGADVAPELPPLPRGPSCALSDLVNEWAFFTPGVLYSFSRFDKNIFAEFAVDQAQSVQGSPEFCCWTFEEEIFQGMYSNSSDDNWNVCLFAIRLPQWESFRHWANSILVLDRDQHHFFRVGVQTGIRIMDPRLKQKRTLAGMPTIQVASLGVDGSQQAFFLDPRRQVYDRPRVMKLEAAGDTKHFMATLFGLQQMEGDQAMGFLREFFGSTYSKESRSG